MYWNNFLARCKLTKSINRIICHLIQIRKVLINFMPWHQKIRTILHSINLWKKYTDISDKRKRIIPFLGDFSRIGDKFEQNAPQLVHITLKFIEYSHTWFKGLFLCNYYKVCALSNYVRLHRTKYSASTTDITMRHWHTNLNIC